MSQPSSKMEYDKNISFTQIAIDIIDMIEKSSKIDELLEQMEKDPFWQWVNEENED